MVTSHNMNDIETLCKRVLIINHGQLIYDGTIRNLTELISNEKIISVAINDQSLNLEGLGKVRYQQDGRVEIVVDREQLGTVLPYLVNNNLISDINIKDIPIEDVIEKVYSGGIA